MSQIKKDRYPGLKAFEKDDTDIFFGRDNDVEAFTNIISSEKIVVLFGTSGTGKSSLLNTKVSRKLEEMSYFPIRIRFTSISNDSNEPALFEGKAVPAFQDFHCLLSEDGNTEARKLSALEFSEGEIQKCLSDFNITIGREDIVYNKMNPRLWEIVKAASLAVRSKQNRDSKGIVLVFDQFEEFFYYSKAEQDKFNEQLAEIIDDWPPKRLLDWINSLSESEVTDEFIEWYTQPPIKVIFSIRSDKLSQVSSMVTHIPKILRTRYELKSFKVENAIEAIERPAAIPNDNEEFFSPPIHFSEGVKTKITNALKNEFDEIECSFLQIVCFYIEHKVKKSTKDLKAVFEFDETMMDANVNVETILDRFYKEQTGLLDSEEKNLVRNVIEDDLVIDGQRASLLASQFLKKLDGKEDLVKFLLKARLVREENTPRGMTYELSHDKLIAAVEKSKNVRSATRNLREETKRLADEAKQSEERVKEKIEQLDKQQKLMEEAIRERRVANMARLKARMLSYIILTLGTLFVIGALFFFRYTKKQEQKNKVYLADILAFKAIDEFDKTRNYEAYNYLRVADEIDDKNGRVDSMLRLLKTDILSGTEIRTSKKAGIITVAHPDSTLEIWNINTRPFSLVHKFEFARDHMLTEEGNIVAVLARNKHVVLFDINRKIFTDDLSFSLQVSQFPGSSLSSSLLLSGNGSSMAVIDSNANLRMFHFKNNCFEEYTNTFLRNADSINKAGSISNTGTAANNKQKSYSLRYIGELVNFSRDGNSFVYCKNKKLAPGYGVTWFEGSEMQYRYDIYQLSFARGNERPKEILNATPVFNSSFNNLRPVNSDSIIYLRETGSCHLFDIRNGNDSRSERLSRLFSEREEGDQFLLKIFDSAAYIIKKSPATAMMNVIIYDFKTGDPVISFVTKREFFYPAFFPFKNGAAYIDTLNRYNFQSYKPGSGIIMIDSVPNSSYVITANYEGCMSGDGKLFFYKKKDSVFVKELSSNKKVNSIAADGFSNSFFVSNDFFVFKDNYAKLNKEFKRLVPVLPLTKKDLLTIYPDQTKSIRSKYQIK